MALLAHNLGYTYGEGTPFSVKALVGVDVSLEKGDVMVIAGTTGSGKSTLLRLLAGLLEPCVGTVEVDGAPHSSKGTRGRVAIVFQNPESQFFAETLLSDVAFGPRNLGVRDPEASATAALGAVGLDPETFGSRSPFTLSGGEARRAAIAGALAMEAPYLLLDEPTAGLDASGRREVLRALAAERERAGIAVVTHDPDEFLGLATHVLALRDGGPAFTGAAEQVAADPGAYMASGLHLPDVAQVQMLARERGMTLPRIAFDPEPAAEALLAAAGWPR